MRYAVLYNNSAPVSAVHAVLIADVIVNGVSINVCQLALALVRRHLVRGFLFFLRLIGQVEAHPVGQGGVEADPTMLLNRWRRTSLSLLLLQALQLTQHVSILLQHVLLVVILRG